MRQLLRALPVLLLLACGDDGPDHLRGLFDLTHIDGQAIPAEVTIDGVDYDVTTGIVDLHNGDLMNWSMAIAPVGGGSASAVVVSDLFLRVGNDSLAFPGDEEAGFEFFGRVSGQTLNFTTIPLTGSSTSFADQVGGAHTWTFRKR